MGNRDDYEKILDVLTAIGDNRIKTPHHIPVDAYIQEAKTLCEWAMKDIDVLVSTGLSRELVEDLPVRIGALIEAESLLYVQRKSGDEAGQTWAKESPLAYDLKNRLLKTFVYAFRDHPELLTILRNVGRGKGHARMIQSLNDLSVIGKKNTALLEAVCFDKTLLDRAAQTSKDMAELLADVTTYRNSSNDTRKIRDLAYTYLKEAVDEIRRCGQFVFRDDKVRFRGYRSAHLREKYMKRKREAKAKTVIKVPEV